MAINPSISLQFQDGALQSSVNLGEDICLKIGTATGGPFLTPTRFSSLNGVLRYLHGPLVRSGAHHADYSQAGYLMRVRASTVGTIGSVTKTPGSGVAASLTTLTLTTKAAETLHAQAAAGAPLSLTTGWTAPSVPLPLKITLTGGGTAAHTQTITGVDSGGATVVEAVAIAAAAGDYYSTTEWTSITKVVTNIDPGGTSDYTARMAGPGDRYNGLLTCVSGGVLGVSGGTTPTYKVSYDGGITSSSTKSLASAGTVDLQTYAGGLTAQYTGIHAAFSAGSLAQERYGSIKVAGADSDGDIMYNMKAAGVTVTHTIGAMGDPLLVSVSTLAITVRGASADGATTTTTAAAAVAAVLASATAAALVNPVAAGTGLSLIAAHGSAGNTTGGVIATALVEGVTYRQVANGASQAISVSVVGKAVTLYATTDSKGNQTTTATLAVAALAANATAATLLSATADTGAGVIGCLTTYTTLPVSIAAGDTFAFTTTPPAWTDSDLQAALTALLGNTTWLGYASVVHVVGDTDDAADVVLATFVGNAASQKKQFKAVVAECTYMGSTAEVTWLASLLSTFATKSTTYGLAAGEANVLNSAYGTIDRMNVGTPYVARLMTCPISELPSHVDCDTFFGTKGALDGVPVRPGDGDLPLWQTDDTLVTLNTSNFITLRTHAGRSGIYVRQGLDFTDDGSDYTFVTNRRIANVAAAIAYDETLRFLNANLLCDPKTGQLAENECQKLEAQVGGRLRKKLVANDRGRQHVSALTFVIDRGGNYVSTGTVTGTVRIVPRVPATTFNVIIGFAPTLTGAQ